MKSGIKMGVNIDNCCMNCGKRKNCDIINYIKRPDKYKCYFWIGVKDNREIVGKI